ncbi:MAG: hypothetical protein LBT09_00325 [Planctomycetaceae bacterium]|nr:hypothetical protein [Planctomycetaceae bacterium]
MIGSCFLGVVLLSGIDFCEAEFAGTLSTFDFGATVLVAESATFGVDVPFDFSVTTEESFGLFVVESEFVGVAVDDSCLQEHELQTKKVDSKIKQTNI